MIRSNLGLIKWGIWVLISQERREEKRGEGEALEWLLQAYVRFTTQLFIEFSRRLSQGMGALRGEGGGRGGGSGPLAQA